MEGPEADVGNPGTDVAGGETDARGRYPRPRLVVSRCLDLEPVRYDGARIPCGFVRRLEPWVELLPVCPELAVGLGVPRDPVRLVLAPGRGDGTPGPPRRPRAGATRPLRMVQPSTGLDLTRRMREWAGRFLEGLEGREERGGWGGGSGGGVDGFLLKARSPSCGTLDVKLYGAAEVREPLARTAGLFTALVLERFPGAAVENEERLEDPRLRERFLVRLFGRAARREGREAGSAGSRGDDDPRSAVHDGSEPCSAGGDPPPPRWVPDLVPPALLEGESGG